ncbi:MAG: hypothetical protein LBO78_04095, partial [Rickettsiales bacterium]|nr:hypothetical protein [Rickettsiales bacterium]
PVSEKVKVIEFVAPKRFAGKTKYGFSGRFKLAMDAIMQFSTRPLRLSAYIGLLSAFCAVALAAYVIVEHFVLSNPTPGYATIITAIAFFGGMQLIVLGIMGAYIGKIHLEVKKRPLYFAEVIEGKGDEKHNSER